MSQVPARPFSRSKSRRALGAPIIEWHIKSTTKAQQGLYEYDAVSRLRDSQLGDARVQDIANYIKRGKLWDAFQMDERPVLLIDEIDKADIEFPNDLLQELDRMEFYVYETGETIKARNRPIVIITSNNEKELPDAFLRRCFFHYIKFPDEETMRAIVEVHFPNLKGRLVPEAMRVFYSCARCPASRRSPRHRSCSTGSNCCSTKTSRRKHCARRIRASLFRRWPVRFSKMSRMCIYLNGLRSLPGAKSSAPARDTFVTDTERQHGGHMNAT